LAIESDQPIAKTAKDLGVNVNTLHTWIGKYSKPKTAVATSDVSTLFRTQVYTDFC
jgi:transposase